MNRLHDDPEREALVTALLAAGPFLITAYNVLEAAKTKDTARRESLLQLMARLADHKMLLDPPNTLIRAISRAYSERSPNGKTIFTVNNDATLDGLWVALNKPAELDDDARNELLTWAVRWESDYDAIAARARGRFQEEFSKQSKRRPPTAAGTMRSFMRQDDHIFAELVAPIYEKETGKILSRPEYDQMMQEPTWALYLGGYAYALHHRSVKANLYSKTKNAGGIDLGQAVYLRLCDRFVTDDRAQFRGLRFLNRFSRAAGYEAEVLTYDVFRRRLLPFGCQTLLPRK